MARIVAGVFSVLLVAALTISAQTELLVRQQDSASSTVENLIEQSNQLEDDSPLLDLLFPESYVHKSQMELRSRMGQALQRSAGYSRGMYTGSPIKSYQRLKFSRGDHLNGGFVLEKDAGEVHLNDFMAGNVTISRIGPISKLVLGDYVVEAGQGIALWRGYDVSKGADVVMPVKRKSSGIRPYVSSGETGFLCGGAVQLQIGNFVPTVFYSSISRSASLDSNQNITSFYTAGYFRTETERSKRGNVGERFLGGHVNYEFSGTNRCGISATSTMFSHPLLLSGGKDFTGDRYSLYSMDYALGVSSASFFGEWAWSNSVLAGISGVDLSPNKMVELIAAFRSYPSGFVSTHGNGFGERSSCERGLYLGVRLQPASHVRLSGYYDQFTFTDQTSAVFPSDGNDALIQVELTPQPRWNIVARYQRKAKIAQTTSIDGIGLVHTIEDYECRQTMRLNVDYRLSKEVRLRGRFERVMFDVNASNQSESGTAFYQDVVYAPIDQFSCDFRVAFFRTDSYSSGIYEYERDLDGVLSMPVLYGRGTRWYFLIKYEPTATLSLSMKYSDHIRDDIRYIGSGYDELPTNHDNRISVQVDWRWN